MKSILRTLQAIMLMAFFVSPSLAQEQVKILFWLPGGEGSTEEAMPILSQFSAELAKSSKLSVSSIYSNSLDEGLELIKQKKINTLIVPDDVIPLLTQSFSKLVSSKPLGTQKNYEQYTLFGQSGTKLENIDTIYTSQEFQPGYVKAQILEASKNNLKNSLQVIPTQSSLSKLKQISSQNAAQSKIEAVLLNSFQANAITKLKIDSLKNIKSLYVSTELPASAFITFEFAPDINNQLTQALLNMESSETGKKTLNDLRLAGFDKTP